MTEKFYKKTDYGFSVEIWSAKESKTGRQITLSRYNSDINALTEELSDDLDFLKIVQTGDIQKIVEIVACYDLRLTTRKYGIGHL